jgi:hypothetical protein
MLLVSMAGVEMLVQERGSYRDRTVVRVVALGTVSVVGTMATAVQETAKMAVTATAMATTGNHTAGRGGRGEEGIKTRTGVGVEGTTTTPIHTTDKAIDLTIAATGGLRYPTLLHPRRTSTQEMRLTGERVTTKIAATTTAVLTLATVSAVGTMTTAITRATTTKVTTTRATKGVASGKPLASTLRSMRSSGCRLPLLMAVKGSGTPPVRPMTRGSALKVPVTLAAPGIDR